MKHKPISTIGIDEVGRGAWAGPMVICAARTTPAIESLFTPSNRPKCTLWTYQDIRITDSKQLTPDRRAVAHNWLIAHLNYSLIEVSVDQINNLGLRSAWEWGIHTVSRHFLVDTGSCQDSNTVIIDGNWLVPGVIAQAIPKADAHYFAVAAASIIAKHHRDTLMQTLHIQFPHYAWNTNVGYGTQAHQSAIIHHGTCKHHRTLWVENWIKKQSQMDLFQKYET